MLQPPVEWFRRAAASILYVACVCRTGLVKSSRHSQNEGVELLGWVFFGGGRGGWMRSTRRILKTGK